MIPPPRRYKTHPIAAATGRCTRADRDHRIMWGKEVGRTLDYLETREDLNTEMIGYFGYSWGARMGGVMLALHDRLRAAVLHTGGLSPLPVQPEADPFNYLPRVTHGTRAAR